MRGGTPSSTAPLLKAAADVVRERVDARGRPRRRAGWALQPTDGWRQQDVLDCLSLLLCSRELLGHVTGYVATTEGGEGGGVSRSVSGSKRCRPPEASHP